MKNKNKFPLILTAILGLLAMASAEPSLGYDQIIRQYQSVRSSGMGGVYETTGFYDQNFFGNPARVCANPTWRITVLDSMVETDTSAISHVSALTGGGNMAQKIAETAGSDNHLRLQTTMPAYYLPISMRRKWAIGVALITSTQLDAGLRNNYETDTQAFIDLGPAVTFGHTFLKDDSLAVGITGHMMYRLASRSPYTITDFLRGTSLSPKDAGGEGTTLDFDVGVTKRLANWKPLGFDINVGLAVDNILGGRFTGTQIHPVNAPNHPQSAYAAVGGGISIHRDSLFHFLHDPTLALEASDIGPRNRNGSFFRTLHLGGESRLVGVFLGRLGINEGYVTAGLGIDLKVLTIDAATYGEELGLNAGTMQDRRYAVRVALQI